MVDFKCWFAIACSVLSVCTAGAGAGAPEKVAGMTLQAPPEQFRPAAFGELVGTISPGWVAIVPYAFTAEQSTKVQLGHWWGERPEGVRAQVEAAHTATLRMMIKPQIWLSGGRYIGLLDFATEAEWRAWEVGVNAYFPVFEPGSWDRIKTDLEAFHKRVGKPIIFTEFGYRSVVDTDVEPWEKAGDRGSDTAAQTAALAALFEAVWDAPWFGDGFLWKWSLRDVNAGRSDHRVAFSVRDKPAAQLVADHYQKNRPVSPVSAP